MDSVHRKRIKNERATNSVKLAWFGREMMKAKLRQLQEGRRGRARLWSDLCTGKTYSLLFKETEQNQTPWGVLLGIFTVSLYKEQY